MSMINYSLQDTNTIEKLLQGGIGVIPTDTVYGIVCQAHNVQAVDRLYTVRQRDRDKALIILIDSIEAIGSFGITLDETSRGIMNQLWPAPLTVLLEQSNQPELKHLLGESPYISFRVPAFDSLQILLKEVGPLVAPSANLQGHPPATSIDQAEKYFGDRVDFYVDGGELNNVPSTVAILRQQKFEIVRQGAYQIASDLTV
jgi:L-threonylcarbamoyladenylate synthase